MNDNDHTDFGAIAAGLLARMPAPAPPPAPEDPAVVRRRWLGDRAQVLLEGGFPPRVVDPVRADQLAEVPALEHARAFRAPPPGPPGPPESPKHILVLLGGVGAGKTTAAAWLAAEIGGSRPGLVRSGALERAGRYDRELAEWVTSRTLLVIDDLGAEYLDGRGAYRSILDELIDVAYGARRRLIVTSNLDVTGIADRVGERIWSRFCAAAVFASCGALDLRVSPPRGDR